MEEPRSAGRKYQIIFAILGLLILVLLFWLFIQRSQLMKLVEAREKEKAGIQKELDSLMTEHNNIKQSFGALSDSLSAKDSIIQQNAIEIRRLLNTEYEYTLIRRKFAMLQKVAQGYVHQMDSLYNVNRELTAENDRIRQEVRTEQNRNQSLMKDKEELKVKMNQAAFLKAYGITAKAYRLKSGGAKETETDKASKTDRIRICFTIGENPLVTTGMKNIYIRLQRPDNVVVVKSKYDTFTFNGQTISYSLREDIDYQGKSKNVCVDWNKKDKESPAMKGRYIVTVFTDETEIGTGSFELR